MEIGLGLGLSRPQGGAISLAAFMAGQSDGFWYDFGQADRLFQENIGPTPANDPTEVIGLAMDQRLWTGRTLAQVTAAQPELFLNPTFDADTDWTKETGWTISGSVATIVAPGAAATLFQPKTLIAGGLYRFAAEVTTFSAGAIFSRLSGGTVVSGPSVAGSLVQYMQAAAGNTAAGIRASSVSNLSIDNASLKLIPGYSAIQATTAAKPKVQSTGATFDGTDDNLLTNYFAATGANFIVAKVLVPATIPVISAIAGCAAASAGKFWLAVNTGGNLAVGLGIGATLTGTSNLRGRTVVVGLSMNGSLARIFVDNAMEAQATQVGEPTLVNAIRIGANNSNGTPASFWPGEIKAIVAGRQFLDLATFNQIASQL